MKCMKCEKTFYVGQIDRENDVVRYCPFCGSNEVVLEGMNPRSSEGTPK